MMMCNSKNNECGITEFTLFNNLCEGGYSEELKIQERMSSKIILPIALTTSSLSSYGLVYGISDTIYRRVFYQYFENNNTVSVERVRYNYILSIVFLKTTLNSSHIWLMLSLNLIN